ncbi:hypothetical protein GCM10020358_40530 [Amorphoplanes nipponensis]|uniref:Erythromycin biosynthesis protein CIII-like C-terminal domain-containing protein n=1 Tax=Actinoplanes nipponensis TaxID=135950 RepID=A0A919MMF4_9ACTN|nr:glycosyltransferase [Actinoplanes nipponensis]GIE47358.1 hypothetical protein Ani05nite_08920 [Actinoplanes nipponensis]
MRFLISTLNASSHLRALAPVAAAARAGGHDVVVAGPPEAGAEVRLDYGLDFRPVGVDWAADEDSAGTIGRHLALGAHRAYTDALKERAFFGDPAVRAAADIRELAVEWNADVVVRVAEEFGGYLAAEALGLPHVAVASGCTHLLEAGAISAELRRLRAAFGLSDQAHPDPYRYLLAGFTPPGYGDGTDAATLRHYRQEQPARVGEHAPAWLTELPTDRPLVYAAFGSVLTGQSWKLAPPAAALVRALGEVPCTAVVAAGDTAEQLRDAAPPSVRVVETVAQPLLLEAADLFVTHAGFGSVREALRAGTPMLALPVIGDEPFHAARCARLGVAKVVPVTAGPRALARACVEVLDTPSYRQAARRVARTVLALPGPDRLVADVRDLVHRCRGVA